MVTNQVFHTHTALANGLRELFKQLEERLALSSPLNVYLAGGMAVHLYTATRVTTDVDAEFAGRVFLPNDLMVEVTLEDGTQQVVYLDTNYNSTFALMHSPDIFCKGEIVSNLISQGAQRSGPQPASSPH
jgi:hypothetical protein